MPIDYSILAEYGTTDDRLREFFTAVQPTPKQQARMTPEELRVRERDIKQRKNFETWISGLLQEHIVFSLSNHSKYAAVDMAWDSLPINNAIVPLIQYAQGRIDLAKTEKWMKDIPNGESFLRKNASGEVVGVDMPKFFEVNVNLLRSVITRRRAAQAVKYDRLWPYFKYEPRDQTQVGKMRADMVSQRMDIMADQYGYRHQESQSILHMMLYARSVSFPRCHWEREIQLERMPGDIKTDADGKLRTRTRVVKEGISWYNPHPSRIFYDNNYPLVSLNDDNGCEYVGFWDVTRWGDIANNGNYFNRKKVSYTSGMVDWFSTYWAYFNQYFTTIIPPSMPQARGDNVNFTNDIKNQVGLFTGQMEQVSTIFTHLWVKARPQNWGWGRYPHPLWVHLKVAGDATVVYAKICPSGPAAIKSYNENDARLMNISLAHELMPFQDQMTNLFSQLLETIKQDLFSVCILNTDVFPDTEDGKKTRAEFEALMQNKATYASMQMLEVSFSKLKQMNINPEDCFKVVRTGINPNIDKIFQAIGETIKLADRMFVSSPHEQGQAASHEISATESSEMSQTTDIMDDYMSIAIDEGRAAMKRICFESLIACGSDEVELTVANRYPESIVQKAGFTVNPDALDDPTGYTKIMGDKSNLVHDYIFTSRDGGDRPAGHAAATVLVQMLQAIGGLEQDMQQAILSAMGKSKVFEIFNEIFRSIDAGVDMKLELKPGETDELLITSNQQFMQSVQRLAQQVQSETQDLTQIHQAVSALFKIIGQTSPQAAQMVAQEMQNLQVQQARRQGGQPQPAGPPVANGAPAPGSGNPPPGMPPGNSAQPPGLTGP